ncbi:MAG: response regulator transcription factor, partial [Bacteroidota bacterium]
FATVLIADKNVIYRKGISTILKSGFSDMQVMESSNIEKLLEQTYELKPEILILDYLQNLESYGQIFKEISKNTPKTSLLVVSEDNDTKRIKKIIDLGVKGFLTKQCEAEEILNAVKFILQGKRFFCSYVLDVLLRGEQPILPSFGNLSTREIQVLELIAKGNTTNKIADKLHISIHTVNSHRKNILKKLQLKSPTQLVAYALEKGLVKLK